MLIVVIVIAFIVIIWIGIIATAHDNDPKKPTTGQKK